ncbi:MAG: FkbM family methyltransferase [Thermoguttaceae bacterium]
MNTSIPQALQTAVAHHQAGRLEEAALIYAEILAAAPDCADAHHLLGLIDAARGRHDLAMERIGHAIRLRPATAVYHGNLGKLLKDRGRPVEAEAAYREAVRLDPAAAEALLGLGLALKTQGRLNEAAGWFRQAAQADPHSLLAQMQLGSAVRRAGNIDEAIACFRRALEIKPDHARAHSNLGSALRLKGRLEEAAACCRRAIQIQPDYAIAHLNLAIIQLTTGDLPSGWPEYEWRLELEDAAVSPLCRPRWDGSPLDGRTILLFLEQGAGDVFQFIRYVPLLRRRGAKVFVECPSGLAPILQAADLGIDRLVLSGSELPPFDVACPLLSLPGIVGTTLENIPGGAPYLKADPVLVENWRPRLEALKGFRVGIVWQGRREHSEDRWRSIPLAEFEPLSRVEGVTLISLQKGDGAEQLCGAGFPVVDWTHQMDDVCGPFTDTAAILSQLDLVIACDSAVAHLAGALGVPAWLALSATADWRWFLDREDSPWYPRTRLFRQHTLGDWQELFRRMASALAAKVGTSEATPEGQGPEMLAGPLTVEISAGELLDKISILQIKAERIGDPAKLANVQAELQALRQARDRSLQPSANLDELADRLTSVNEALWQVENELRHCEALNDFGPRFVELARSVYRHNDLRSSLKRQINTLAGSRLLEEKSYASAGDATPAARGPLKPQPPSTNATWIDAGPVRLKTCRYGPMLYLVQDRYIGQSLDLYGEFSHGEMDLLRQVVQAGQVVLDIGANIGTHTVFFAQAVGPAGLVFAFEPQRVLFQMLCGNLALNGLTNVHARQAAVGQQTGTIRVPTPNYASPGNFGGVSLQRHAHGEETPLLTVDQLDLPACHLVKIDVEDMEGEVVAGAERTLRRLRPVLYLENDRQERSAALIDQLFALDYRLYWHLPPLFNPDNYFGQARNLFPNIVSANMLGIHRSAGQNISLREIRSPDQRWSDR